MIVDRVRNHLLAALSERERDSISQNFDEATLTLGQVMFREGEPLKRIYFPTRGMISAVAPFESHTTVEMASIGREGMTEVSSILQGNTALNRTPL